jgi:rare lipoprotein A
MQRIALAACLSTLVVPVVAASEPAGPRISGWRTSVHQANPALHAAKPSAAAQTARRDVETGSLPPSKVALPKASLSGGPHAMAGIASFYWQDQKTANGERFDKMAMTAAHRTLPFNTRVRVTHLGNGRSVVVRINDRGPFKPGRVIDLSHAAAGVIDMHAKGLAHVKVEVVQ